jgi:hypothetical protein
VLLLLLLVALQTHLLYYVANVFVAVASYVRCPSVRRQVICLLQGTSGYSTCRCQPLLLVMLWGVASMVARPLAGAVAVYMPGYAGYCCATTVATTLLRKLHIQNMHWRFKCTMCAWNDKARSFLCMWHSAVLRTNSSRQYSVQQLPAGLVSCFTRLNGPNLPFQIVLSVDRTDLLA